MDSSDQATAVQRQVDPLGHFECYTLYFDYKTTKLLAACGRVIDDVEIQYEFLNVVFDPSSWQPPNIGKYRVIDVE